MNVEERDQKLARLDRLITSDPMAYSEIQPLMDSIYRRGVIESTEGMAGRQLFVLNGNFAQPAVYGDFFTVRTAADLLEQRLKNKNLKVYYLDFLAITHYINPQKSDLFLNSRLEQLSLYKSVVKSGEMLVKRGEAMTNNKRFLVNAYFDFQNSGNTFSAIRFIAKWALCLILCMVLIFFLAFFRKPIFGQNQQVAFLFLMLMASVFSVFLFYKYSLIVIALPFTLVPILVRVFFDGRTALFTYLMTILICSFFMPDKIEFILMQLITGIGTLFAIAEMRKRQQILNAAALVFVFYL